VTEQARAVVAADEVGGGKDAAKEAAGAAVGRAVKAEAGWAGLSAPGQADSASAPSAAIRFRTCPASRATARPAPSAER